jgi:hypothetical protein
MSRKIPLSVIVLDRRYRIMESPEILRDPHGARCKALADHEQCVLWIDPKVRRQDREQVIANAISLAWRVRMRETPLVD